MFEARITDGKYTYYGTVYQIVPIDGVLCAVYRMHWLDEWRTVLLDNVEPVEDDPDDNLYI